MHVISLRLCLQLIATKTNLKKMLKYEMPFLSYV